ncbi:MAG TPA: cytochrome c biogenesis protein DipZ [Candidatus Limnocylindrales bacterium]|nr:cytochrome c biogenesis protein DipZ [Candidatus Limnocylindrales bacterium]
MLFLIGFAFLAGIITILSPCILPILPIVLSGSVGSGKRKPQGIVLGFVLSFTFFTLFLSAIVRATGVSADALRIVSIVILLLFGVSLLSGKTQVLMEKLFSRLSNRFAIKGHHDGFLGGIFVGLSLGLLWTPCVGPILASVITLAATSEVSFSAFFITLAYSLGTAIPMFAIMYGGRGLIQKIPWLLPNAEKIQKGFGVLMVLTALGIFFNIDRKFQTYVLETFPKYGAGLIKIEDNEAVKKQLDKLFKKEPTERSGQVTSDGLSQQKVKAPEIIPGGVWLNSEPLTIRELKGKVVLIDFWTYTCINCQRTMPYLNDWYAKYKDKGFVIVGVHSPEFEFEKSEKNLTQAILDFKLKHPVIQDNNFDTWNAYNNRYWPAKYLVDKDGYIRYTHFGEGAYDATEKAIQDLLKETGQKVDVDIKNETTSSRQSKLSPEGYLGSQRMLDLMGSGKAKNGNQQFTLSKDISPNKFSFGGTWNITKESAIAVDNAVLSYNFNANKVFLVMNPGAAAGTVKVYLDGKLVDLKRAGRDVKNGSVIVDSDRLYELINLKGDTGNHLMKLEFTPGIGAFAFTFG